MNDLKRLVLLDGHAILHRAYHALPPTLTAPDGMTINAIYGFMTMLLKTISDLKPSFLAVAFDLPQATFRMQEYTAYQARRPEMVSNLSDQIPLIHELLAALGIPVFEVGGFEADDCIGTLATQASKRGIETYIVTGDRDFLQLVDEWVKVYIPVKGLTEVKVYTKEKVEEEFGVLPTQWVDVKALKGDSSDNYPGVAGIGPKTAQELIKKYGTLEEVYKHLGELPEWVAKKLAEGAEQAGQGQRLARIVCEVPTVKLDLELARTDKINWQEGITYMKGRLGFKTIVSRIQKELLGKEEKGNKKTDSEQIGLL